MLGNVKSLFKTLIAKNMNKSEDIDYSRWIFSSSNNTEFNYNSKYLFEHVLKHENDITPLYVINDDNARKNLKRIYGEEYFIETKTIKGILKVLKAGVWFTSAGLPVYGFGLSKNRFIVNLWHGVPLKKIALMENRVSLLKKLYFKKMFSENLTHILTTSTEMIPVMSESFDVSKSKIKVWGQPRNDVLFEKNNKKEILSRLYCDLPEYNRIILYAPTFRDDERTILFPFEDMDFDAFNHYLETNKILIFIRAHQFEGDTYSERFGDRVKFINSDKQNDIMDILNIFDLLITDYSSIYIDYLLTGNPVMFLPYDQKKYFKKRGMNFNYDDVTPGPKPNNYKSFVKEIERLLNNDNYYKKNRIEINHFFNEVDGKCSLDISKSIKFEIEN